MTILCAVFVPGHPSIASSASSGAALVEPLDLQCKSRAPVQRGDGAGPLRSGSTHCKMEKPEMGRALRCRRNLDRGVGLGQESPEKRAAERRRATACDSTFGRGVRADHTFNFAAWTCATWQLS